MKKVVLPVVLVLTGMLLALVVLPRLGLHFGGFDAVRMKSTSYTVSESFDSLSVRGGDCDVSVYASYDGVCRVYIRKRGSGGRSVRVEDGVLVVENSGGRRWFEKLGLAGAGEQYISIELPEQVLERMDLHADGDVYVEEEVSAGEAAVSCGGGDVSFYAAVSGALTIEAADGDVYLSMTRPQTLSVRSAGGDISADSVAVSGEAELTSGSGDIWMWDFDAAEVRLKSDSGDISATFLTPKNFETDTAGGSVSAPRSDKSAGTCSAVTGSGDIWLSVEDESGEN